MDSRWQAEQVNNWITDFLIDDAGSSVSSELAPHAPAWLKQFRQASCDHRQLPIDQLEEVDVQHGLMTGFESIAIPDSLVDEVPLLIGNFLYDLGERGRISGGVGLRSWINALGSEFSRTRSGETASIERVASKIGRNDPCPCGSELKYKKCCLRLLDDESPK